MEVVGMGWKDGVGLGDGREKHVVTNPIIKIRDL